MPIRTRVKKRMTAIQARLIKEEATKKTTLGNLSDYLTLIGIALSGVITIVSVEGAFDVLDAIVGILLAIFLSFSSYKNRQDDFTPPVLATTAVWGICVFLVVAFLVDAYLTVRFELPRKVPSSFSDEYLIFKEIVYAVVFAITFLSAFAVIWIDRNLKRDGKFILMVIMIPIVAVIYYQLRPYIAF